MTTHADTPISLQFKSDPKALALETRRAIRRAKLADRLIEVLLACAAAVSVLVTAGIVFVLLREAATFFSHVSIVEFLTSTDWTPLFANPKYGILPLITATAITSAIALAVAMPLGLVIAIYLSEFASARIRELLKPTLELLSAVPTVVFGYFALLLVTPLLQRFIPNVAGFNMLSAGLTMGLMIVPYISSLSEDAMHAVPMLLREGSYALGANRLTTAIRVVIPAALSGIGAACVLAVSRAIGETMIVAIAAGMQPRFILDPREGAATLTAFIVQVCLGDAPFGSIAYQSIFAAGLTLFLLNLGFNAIAHYLRQKYREAY
ncbi:MAG: phosphate ABC transporter permease subunit PstC [Candidatus Hydrogenedentota bacterium]|jgi:phosphate transport system permease protein|uniref:Phosphate transport system permease protein n=1 Tax=Sumerlaea chitinivorans TaxID=2250252 RepID=A0A2Z4Y257_SUMC1|nr:Phosphate transport system permease protein PstC [Candidatus Sumerlaea chitinivorans]MCX7963298.1 phosphate ABC transporter permease subunit PstC [Candidatus Sumerlaea chitinivorans]RMH29725.1 MAG: phosphate ABC transporter permease subunit PstC [Candidatus Hydrogenedentota bacterium]GIX44778.1 MAG: phosphate transport system permease protein [Candidatus Sumerlaea sp.]